MNEISQAVTIKVPQWIKVRNNREERGAQHSLFLHLINFLTLSEKSILPVCVYMCVYGDNNSLIQTRKIEVNGLPSEENECIRPLFD